MKSGKNATRHRHTARTWVAGAVALSAPLALGACSGSSSSGSAREHTVDAAPLVRMSAAGQQKLNPDTPVTVTAVHGKLTDVTVTGSDGRRLAGQLAADGLSWHSTAPLAAGAAYQARISADDGSGGRGSVTEKFTTAPPQKTLTASFATGTGNSFGVGEPIAVTLSQPVHDPAARQVVERALTVRSKPSVTGAWYWVDDKTLHFRPEKYWPAHATVQASFSMPGTRVSTGLYGGAASQTSFGTRDAMVAVADAHTDHMTVTDDGKVVKRLPITTGKPGFDTRNGIKVVLEQQSQVFMDSSTVGIAAGSSNSYALDVKWATRVTWSGEYVHAAPWSVGSQGVANVSHGCVGMSTDDAHWFYDAFRPGDVVQVVNSKGHEMEHFGNGYGDWNLSWADWLKGSALHHAVTTQAPVATGGAAGAKAAPTTGAQPAAAPATGAVRPTP